MEVSIWHTNFLIYKKVKKINIGTSVVDIYLKIIFLKYKKEVGYYPKIYYPQQYS